MRLLRLDVKCYGHFANQQIDLGGEGVQLVVGPNEAGKTTLLEFIREMLFGFAERNVYDFGEGRPEGTATMRCSSGELLELRRHKGRKRTVDIKINGRETELGAEDFNRLLGGATAGLFRSVFAFGLKELAEADQSLNESVRTALFGGGLASIGNPKRILDSLNGEAAKLFQERAQRPTINALCSELKDLTRQVREKSIRCDTYWQARSQLDEAERDARLIAETRAGLVRQHSQTNKLLKAHPVWHDLGALRQERAGLTAPNGFPAEAKDLFLAANATIRRNEGQRQRLKREIEECEQSLRKLDLDPALLEQRVHVEHANRMVQSVTEARRDLPLREAELNELETSVKHGLAELVPDWTLEQLTGFSFDAASESALDALAHEREQLDKRQTELVTRRVGNQNRLHGVAMELRVLPESEDMSVLRALLENQADYTSDLKELARLSSARKANSQAIGAMILRLNPPFASSSAAHELPVPPKETVAKFKQQFLAHEQRVAAAERTLAEEETALDVLEKELAALCGGSASVPTRESLARMRARRDAGWSLIRRKHIAGEDAEEAIDQWLSGATLGLPEAYEEAVREADHYSDVILAQASAVAKQEQIVAARRRTEAKRRALAELDAAAETLNHEWQNQWSACHFAPLDPAAMETWLDNHAKLRGLIEEDGNLATEIDALAARTAAFEAELSASVGGREGKTNFTAMLLTVRERVKNADEVERKRIDLHKLNGELGVEAAQVTDDLSEHAKCDETWQAKWKRYLAEIGFPLDWTVAFAQKVIGRLRTARERLRSIPQLELRIGQMRQRLAEFDALVGAISAEVAIDDSDKLPEVGVAMLQERLTAAVKLQERHDNLQNTVSEKRASFVELDAELTDARHQRSRLLSLAGAESDEDFLKVAERAARIVELDETITGYERELARCRENEHPATFDEQLRHAEVASLQQQEQDLAHELEDLERNKKSADERVGSCRQVLAELEKGTSQAAILQETAAGKRARLAAEVDRYVPLVFAQTLLEQAIKKFEQESQPAMLTEVSSIFKSMTAGRYVRIQRSDDENASLCARRFDEKLLEPHELSTGTREQLYLAIRLAYVLHYCSRAEPLPIVMDDVLANFDDERALQTLRALGEVSQRVQVLMFTCHEHLLTLAKTAFPDLRPVEIGPPLRVLAGSPV